MSLLSLLGKSLKDDDVVELLEFHDMEVIYDFDRSHEGTPDVYWAPAKSAGFQLRFNQEQRLDVIFCYIEESEGFSTIDTNEIGVSIFETFDLAERAAKDQGLNYEIPEPSLGQRFHKWWLKIHLENCSVHYQFKEQSIHRVTISLAT